MKPWHKQSGLALGERGEEAVELALMLMMDAIRILGPGDLHTTVLREAEFRVRELPKRAPAYQLAYLVMNDSGGPRDQSSR